MAEGLASSGVLSKEELAELPGMPSEERLKKGAVAVIECAEEIPCNPCESACPRGAIEIGENINSLPILKEELCTGCGLCIPVCPGLAIFIVDLTFSEQEALVQLPHEFLPLPKQGATVNCLNRKGQIVSQGRVVKVTNPKKYDRTPVISVAVPKELGQEVRAIRLGNEA
jgi:Fe-S-cluster-containing hydrogenase component 2